MNVMLFLSNVMIPLLIFCIVGYGILNKQNIYEEFIEGAKDGFSTVIGIMPTLIGLMVMIPLLIFCIVGYGILNKQNIYEEFIEGAKDGFSTVIGIMPTLIGLMVAVGILRASGFLEFFAGLFADFTDRMGFPSELLPLTVVKMFSSSAATGLLLDLYKEYGADSMLGKIASIMMSSTETIFYTMSVYFMTAKIKKSRYTLAGALLATLAGTVASIVLAGWM